MAYFNHAFRKTLVMQEFVAAGDGSGVATTADLGPGQVGMFNAQTFQLLGPAADECPACPFMIVSGSPYANDRIGPFHGGYQESIKSKGINPRYTTKIWDGLANEAQPFVLHVGTTSFTEGNDGCCPEFLCGENYHLRVDVKGSPALRMLNHQGYVEVTAYGGCCPDQPDDPLIAPVPVDPALIMIQWAEGIWESVVVTGNGPNFSNQGPASAAARVNPDPLLVPVVYANVGGTITLMYPPGWLALSGLDPLDAALLAQTGADVIIEWDAYVSPGYTAGDCAGLSLVGAYEDTRFGDCTFQTSDWYGLEPVRIYASEVDLNGAPCEFTGICIEAECEGRQANGLGETALRDFILSESYRQNHFATDLRIREITQGDDMLTTALAAGGSVNPGGIDRRALYDRVMIQHSVPRYNNPTGTFDNDQYVVEILTLADADDASLGADARAAFVKQLGTYFDAASCGELCDAILINTPQPCDPLTVPVSLDEIVPIP